MSGPTPGDSLPGALSQISRDERQQALRALLRTPLLSGEGPDGKSFGLVRKHAGALADWLQREAGWYLSVDAELARLRKLPADAGDATRPARNERSGVPFNRRRYVVLCLALAVLENADAQITLGRLGEQVLLEAGDPVLAAAGMRFTMESRDERADLVTVVRLLLETHVLARVAGEEQAYVSGAGDALYDIDRRALAGLLVNRNGPSTIDADTIDDRIRALAEEWLPDSDEARNQALRQRLTRRLLDDPVVYYDELSDDELAYLTSQRAALVRRVHDNTGFVAEARAEGLAMLDPSGEATDMKMPEEGTLGHFTLLLAERLAAAARAEPGRPWPPTELLACARELVAEHGRKWSKTARQAGGAADLVRRAVERLEGLGLVRVGDDGVIARPACARYRLESPDVPEAEPEASGEPGEAARSQMELW